MNNPFEEALKNEALRQDKFFNNPHLKLTENFAYAYSSTANPLLDLFGVAGGLRARNEDEIAGLFEEAFEQNRILATIMMFYIGDVRGGLGERRTFRTMFNWLAENHSAYVARVLDLVPEYTRWDNLWGALNTAVGDSIFELVHAQLRKDYQAMLDSNEEQKKPISLLAKWLPSTNASSTKTKALAKDMRKGLGSPSEKDYRQVLSKLRAHIGVVEKLMSAGEWNKINFENVPSYAMKNYRNAFLRHEEERFQDYLKGVESGTKEIKASVLFPYDLVRTYMPDGYYRNYYRIDLDKTVELQWKNLPNYLEGAENSNVLVMADVSGSMIGRPMLTSVGLAIYFSERNKGFFKDSFMTFTDSPRVYNLEAYNTLQDKVAVVTKHEGYNTNLELAFKKVLEIATNNNVGPEEMPAAILVISDMEIDRVNSRDGYDFLEAMKLLFAAEGYKLPQLICWNVESRQNTFLSQNENVLLVSGQSPAVFKQLMKAIGKDAVTLMLDSLNQDRYKIIRERLEI